MMFQYSELLSFKLQNTLEKHEEHTFPVHILVCSMVQSRGTKTLLCFSPVFQHSSKETTGHRIVSDSNNSLVIIAIWVRLTKSVQQEP